jgi:hypothetical protein
MSYTHIRISGKALMAGSEARSVFDTPQDDSDEARKDAVADAEIAAGGGVPHEQVRQWLAKLVKA